MMMPVLEGLLMTAAAAVAVAIAIRSPFHAFCILVVTLPFENALVFTSVFTVTPSHLALLLLIGVCAFQGFRHGLPGRLNSPLHKFVLIYLGVSLLSIVMTIVAPPPVPAAAASAGWRAGALRPLIQISLLLFMSTSYFATVFFCSRPARFKKVMAIYMATAALIALYGIYQVVAVLKLVPMVAPLVLSYFGIASSFRPNATFREPLIFGHFLLTALPLAIALFLHRERLARQDRVIWGIGLLPVIALMAAALLATIARGAWFGFIGSMGILLIVTVRMWGARSLLRALPAAMVISIGAVIAIRQAYASWYDMFWSIANRFDFFNPINVAAEQRLPFIPFLLGLARDYPVLGVGYGNYPFYQIDRFGGGIAGAYGLYFQSLVETGVLGLAALLALIGAVYLHLWRALHGAAAAQWGPWLAGCIAGLTGLWIQYFTFGDRLSAYMWVFMGLSMALVNIVHDERSTPA
jgi:O-antigen ligase